jgi:hypothetical protein
MNEKNHKGFLRLPLPPLYGNVHVKKSTTFLLIMAIMFSVVSCKQESGVNASTGNEDGAKLKTLGAQPLPGGKARFTVTLGNIDSSPWVRLGNWTFDAATGTVAATFYTWSYDDKHDVAILPSPFHQHRCSWDGVSKFVFNYTPYGWMSPSGVYQNWSGTYTYVGTLLTISWNNGAGAGNTEQWDVSLPETGLARVKYVLNSSTYHVTNGRGYGSNAPWPNAGGTNHPAAFKTMTELPNVTVTSTTGRLIKVSYDSDAGTTTITPTTAGSWTSSGAAWNTADLSAPSEPTPISTKHRWSASDACNGKCKTTRTGIMYHLASTNNNRQMAWINFCACLPADGVPANTWPGYDGNMHPSAMLQILDDNSVMKGVVGIESQNPPSTGPQNNGYPSFQMQLYDFTTVAGS